MTEPTQPAQPALPASDDPTAWAVPQSFEPATSYQLRNKVVELTRRDLLGPWDAGNPEFEELAYGSPGPLERYLVGRLGPRRTAEQIRLGPDDGQDTDTELAGDYDPSDADPPDLLTVQNRGKMWPSSLGLSFTVGGDTDVVNVTATWGRYGKAKSLDPETEKERSVWARRPYRVENEVRIDGPEASKLVLDGDESEGVLLRVEVRPCEAPDGSPRRVVELALVNNLSEPGRSKDTAWLFQPELRVTALDGAAPVFLPVGDRMEQTPSPTEDGEELHLDLLYRNVRKYADGRNVAVTATADPDADRARELRTEWLPTFDVPMTIAPPIAETPTLQGLVLSMDRLAEMPQAELKAALSPLADGYRTWLAERKAEVAADLPEGWWPVANQAIYKAETVANRVEAGISLLTENSDRGREAFKAFQFANEAMASQRRHTALTALRDDDPSLSYAQALSIVEAKGEEGASWRPFQLAFVLLNVPALADPTHTERTPGIAGLVDLLFFPTGGGKTEAYLGLAGFTFAIRRLQKTVGTGDQARDGGSGVAVLMRYTLRLLTAQQFQRAAAMVCAAEVIRRRDPNTWGTTPFRIGLWVGTGVAPNWYTEAEEEIKQAKDSGRGDRVRVLQILSCPWCGQGLKGHDDLDYSSTDRRILLYCPNSEGRTDAVEEAQRPCPFSKRRAKGEGLPILTVDEEIYRLLPALVVATVDKFAQLPWQGYAGMLFGRVSRWCPRHGYRHADLDARIDCGEKHLAAGPDFPAVKSEPVTRLRPPDLIIQDELHLISGALGTTVGLFESAVDLLCRWQVTDSGDPGKTKFVGPKIVASTATTKRSADQVKRLFARKLSVFPPQVTDVADTFFSRQVPVSAENPGRRYLGVCSHGVRLKSAEIRLAEILLIAGQELLDKHGDAADPYLTLVGYFNATRELAGMRRLLEDDVTTRIRRNGAKRGLSNRLSRSGTLDIAELTSRISSADITAALKQLEVGFDDAVDTSARKQAIGGAIRAFRSGNGPAPEGIPDRRNRPVDVVLATSMLQVGVDVSRFGLMVVTGQPKNTAEYIQASSRVGRDPGRPGLVVTLYNWSRPRDLAHYEDFEDYHATFYRRVEALSVTPYARRSLDRGTAATFTAAVRNAVEVNSRNTDAQDVDLDGPIATRVRKLFLDRAKDADGERGRDYFDERIAVFRDAWIKAQHGTAALGYSEQPNRNPPLAGLLEKPSGPWTVRTVGMSMRETENDINLLVSGSEDELFGFNIPSPSWVPHVLDADGAQAVADLAEDDIGTVDEFGTPDGGNGEG